MSVRSSDAVVANFDLLAFLDVLFRFTDMLQLKHISCFLLNYLLSGNSILKRTIR